MLAIALLWGAALSELSGSLADFDLRAVMRLLAAGSKTGILVVHGTRLEGSMFFHRGELTYATTRRNNAGPMADDRRDGDPPEPAELLADVAARLARQDDGSFIFQADVHPAHTVEATFTVDDVLVDVASRLETWSSIDDELGSVAQPYAMAADQDDDETIQLTGREWNVLCSLGSGRSVERIAELLRLPELDTAQILVRLKTDGLVAAIDGHIIESATTQHTHGGRLIEPDRADVFLDLTGRDDAGRFGTGDESDEELEEPASDLAARWRTLRSTSREELLDTP